MEQKRHQSPHPCGQVALVWVAQVERPVLCSNVAIRLGTPPDLRLVARFGMGAGDAMAQFKHTRKNRPFGGRPVCCGQNPASSALVAQHLIAALQGK